MSIDFLGEKKLKIWSKAVTSQVLVWQDGSAADADATILVNNAFRDGYQGLAHSSKSMQRVMIDVEELSTSRTGKEFVFNVQDFLNRNTFALGPGDVVEFYATNGSTPSSFSGSFPAWHSANQGAAQTLLFFGFIRDVKRVERVGGFAKYQVTCEDAIAKSNVIKLQQSKPNAVTIPWLIFNCDRYDDTDYFFSVKTVDSTTATIADRYGYAWPNNTTKSKMTLQEIFEYLEDAYQADLFTRGIIDGANIFDPTDLAQFSAIYPPKTVFEASGFGNAVRQLLAANAPDFDVFVDPRTRLWRFVATAKDIVAGGFATIASTTIAKTKWVVDDASFFATSGTGSTVRLQSATDPRASEVAFVSAVNLGTQQVTLTTATSFAFGPGDYILPMYSATARPPAIQIDLEQDCKENDLAVDLNGVYTAVSIVSRKQKSSKIQVSQTADATYKFRLAKQYSTAIEANHRDTEHRNRRIDRGLDGNGLIINEIETADLLGSPVTRIYFSEESSLYAHDHEIGDGLGYAAEWTGTAFHLLTYDAGATNCESQAITAVIERFTRAGWADAAQTKRRFCIQLDKDLVAQVPTMKGAITHSTTGDRFEMSSSDVHGPVSSNARWNVGRLWKVESTTPDNDARYADNAGCPAEATFLARNQEMTTITAVPVERVTESGPPSDFAAAARWAGMAAARAEVANGPPRIFWLRPPDPGPTFAQLCAKLPPPIEKPVTFTLSMNYYSHQVLQVRSPSSGFTGNAWLWHKHAEELQLVMDSFEDESQSDQFSLIAESIRSRISDPSYTGSLTLRGITRWLPLCDLGFRVTFGPGDTGYNGGVVTEQRRFWGLCETIRYSFKDGVTSLSFHSTGFGQTLQKDLFERQFVSETAEMKALAERVRRNEQLLNCVATRDPGPTAQVTDGCRVSAGPQSVVRKTTTINVKEIGGGYGETSMGAPQGSAGGLVGDPGSNRGSMDFNPAWIIERNYLGKPFAISNPGGAVYGGTDTGSRFVPSFVDPGNPIGLPQHTADSLNEIGLAVLGIDLQTPKQSTLVECTSGSTTTIIQLLNAIPDDGRFVGGFIEFRENGVARPKYTIASHTAHSVTLTGAMSEAAPVSGAMATIWAARLPDLNPTDFPQGGRMFKDRVGSWFVASQGQIYPATLAGTTLSKASSATAPDLGVITKKSFDGLVIDHEQWIDFSANPSFDGGTGTIAATNPGQTSATVYNGDLSIYNYTDGSKRGNLIVYRLPTDLDESSPLSLTVIYRLNGAVGGTPNVEISIDALVTMDSDPPTTGTTVKANITQNMDTLARVSTDIVHHAMGNLLSSMTGLKGGLLHGVIYRDATGSADDYTGTVQAVGAVLRMKRRIGGSDNDGNQIGGADAEDTARLLLR